MQHQIVHLQIVKHQNSPILIAQHKAVLYQYSSTSNGAAVNSAILTVQYEQVQH